MKIRNSFVEILRVYCVFGIIMMHKNGFMMSTAEGAQIPWVIFVSAFNFESALLIMISAYYGNPYSSRKRLIRLWLMVLFYTYIHLICKFATNRDFLSEGISGLTKELFPIFSGKCWFVSGYIIIWLLAPYIERITETLTRKEFKMMLFIILVFFSFVPSFIMTGILSKDGKDIGTLMAFYLLGRYLKKYNIFESYRMSKCIMLVMVGFGGEFLLNVLCVLCFKAHSNGAGAVLLFSNDYSFWGLLIAIGFLGASTKLNFHNKIVNVVGKHTFGIFLTESIVVIPFGLEDFYQSIPFGWYYLMSVFAYVIFVMSEGFFIDAIRKRLMFRIEDRIINCITNGINWIKNALA